MKCKYIARIITFSAISFFCFNCTSLSSGESGGSLKTLDRALYEAAKLIDSRAHQGSRIALVNFNTPTNNLSSYCFWELEANLLNFNNLVLVDRSEIELRRSELNYQVSGEVSDSSMKQLGRTMGVENIISGTVTEVDGVYRLIVRVLAVESGLVMAQYRSDIVNDARFRNVSGYRGAAVETAQAERDAKEREKQRKKDEKEEFLRTHPMKQGYYALAAQAVPFFDSDFNYMKPMLITGGIEYVFSSIGLDINYSYYLNSSTEKLYKEETNPDRKAEGSLHGANIDSLHAMGLGLHYSFYGMRWIFSLGPGFTYVFLDAVDENGSKVGGFLSTYAQARFNIRLTSYELFGVYLRAGYRVDYNNSVIAKYQIFDDVNGTKSFLTHSAVAGIIFTSK